MADQKLTVSEFAAKIKAKYPEYKDIDDLELSRKIVDKYPEYESVVVFEDQKKKEDSQEPFRVGVSELSSDLQSQETPEQVSEKSEGDYDIYAFNPIGRVIKNTPVLAELQSGIESMVGSAFKLGEMFVKENVLAYATANPAYTAAQNAMLSAAPIDNKLSQALGAMGDFYMDDAAKVMKDKWRDDYNISDEDAARGIVGNIAEGNYGTAAKMAASTMVQQIPQLGVMAATGGTAGAVVLGATAAGGKYAEIQDDPTLSSQEKALYSLAIGTAEGVAENLFKTDFRQFAKIFGKEGTKETFKKALKKELKKETLLGSTFEEATEEFLVAVTDNLVENGLRGNFDNWDREAVLEIADNTLIGGLMGGSIHGLSRGVNAVGSTKNEREVARTKNNVTELMKKRENAKPEEQAIIDEMIEEEVGKLIKTQGEDAEFYNKFTEQDRTEVLDLNKKIRTASKRYNVAPSDAQKAEIKKEIDDLRAKKTAVENKYAEDGGARYIRDGKEVSKEEFVEMVNNATPEDIATGQWGVENDDEVTELLLNKMPQEETKGEEVASPEPEVKPDVQEAPVQEAPVQEAPVQEPAVEEQPVAEASKEEAPVDVDVQKAEEEVAEDPVVEETKKAPSIPLDAEIEVQDVVSQKDNEGNTRFFARYPLKDKDISTFFEVKQEEDGTITRVSDKSYGPAVKTLKRRLAKEETTAKPSPIQEVDTEAVKLEESTIEDAEFRIEDLQSEIQIEEGNIKEAKAKAKEDIAAVRKSKLSKEAKAERIEEINAELQDAVDDMRGNIGIYKDDIRGFKSDIKKANKKLDKLRGVKPTAKTKQQLTKGDTVVAKLEKAEKGSDKFGNSFKELVDNFNNTVSKLGGSPIPVYVVDQSTYEEVTGKSSRGSFTNLDGKKSIVINADKASLGTVYHEMMHGYISSVKMSPKQIVELANTLKSQLRKGNAQEKKLATSLDAFQKEYIKQEVYGKGLDMNDPNIAEEFLSEFVAQIKEGIDVNNMSLSTVDKIRLAVANFINKVLNAKIDTSPIQSRQEAFDFIENFLDALEGRTEVTANEKSLDQTQPLTESPIEISSEDIQFSKEQIETKGTYIKESDLVNVKELFSNFKKENGREPKVWIWMSDQLKRGQYNNEKTGVSTILEGGVGFAYDQKNKAKNVAWASGLSLKTLNERVEKADFIWFMAGSEKSSFNFSKGTTKTIIAEIEAGMSKLKGTSYRGIEIKKGNYSEFAKIGLEILKEDKTKKWSEVKKALKKGADVVDHPLRAKIAGSLLNAGTTAKMNLEIHQFLHETLGVPKLNEYHELIRDEFLKKNNYANGDMSLIIKPTGVKADANVHDTYPHAILGDVVGMPSKKNYVLDVVPEESKTVISKSTGLPIENAGTPVMIKTAVGDVGAFYEGKDLDVKQQIDFAGIEMKTKETAGNTDPIIKTGGTAYVPVSTLYNLMDMRDGDRGGLYETAEDKKRVQELVKAFKKEGFEYKGSDHIYIDIDAQGYGWIGEGNHRVLAARELGMSHLPVRVEFGAARDGISKYANNYSRVPTRVISKEKINDLKEKAEPHYHIKYASIWNTDLPTNKEPSGDKAKQQIDWKPSLFGRGQVNPAIVNRTTEVQEAASELLQGKITNTEYKETVRITQAIEAITDFFLPASTKDMQESLDKNKGKLLNVMLEDGTEVGLRLDIPAYKNRNIWVVSIHDKGASGKSLSYGSVAWATDVKFGSNPKVASFIAAGKNMDTLKKQDKTTIARMLGKWKNFEGKTKEERDASAVKKVEEIVKIENSFPGAGRKGSPWRQVGMNPFRHSFFYDRRNGKPIVSAAEVVQIGGLVYAKDVEYADWSDDQFTVNGYKDADGQPVKFQIDNDPVSKVEKKQLTELEKGEIPKPTHKKAWYMQAWHMLFRTQLETEILKLQESKEGLISRTEEKSRVISNKIKKYAKTEEALALANEYLTADDKKEAKEKILALPRGEKLLSSLREARAFIDSISESLINDPAFEGLSDDLVMAIQQNLTTYLRTQYRFFTDKNFDINKRRDPAIQAQFKELMISEIALLNAQGLSPLDIQRIVNERRDEIRDEAVQMIDGYISDLEDVKYQPSKGGAGIKLPNAPFKRKQELPAYIEQLLGKEKNPINRFAQTSQALANVLYKGRMVEGILDIVGPNSDYILDEDPGSPKNKHYTKINDPYSKLNGKWVHNEITDALEQKPLYSSDKAWANGYFNVLKLARKSKVIWNITTWRKNLTGGWYFIMANGVANPKFAKDFSQRTKLMFKKTGETWAPDAETESLLDLMAEYGLIGKSIDANLIGMSQAAMQYGMDGDENAYNERAKRIWGNIKNKDKWLQEKYGAVDDYTKLIIFRSEIQTYAKKLYGKEYDSLTEAQKNRVHKEAAERVKESTPTFSRLPKWFNNVAAIPVVGDFVSFRLESLRSYGQNVWNGASDIAKSQEKGLTDVQKKAYLQAGLRRVAGSAAVFALKTAIVTVLSNYFLGDDDEELEDAAKLLRPEWMSGQTIIPRSIDKDGNVRVYNYSSEDPYGDVSDIFGGPESWSAMVKDFIRPNIAADLLFNLVKGEDIYGKKIADYSDSKINNIIKVSGYVGKQIVVPPTISSSFRDAYLRSDLPKKDKVVNLASMVAERSLIRDYKYNIVNSLVQDLRKISETRKSYEDYDNPAKRKAQLDDIREKWLAVVKIGNAKGNYEMIDKAERYIKTHLLDVDQDYFFYE